MQITKTVYMNPTFKMAKAMIFVLLLALYACHTFDPEPPSGLFLKLGVETIDVSSVSATSATSGGSILLISGVQVTARGVVWSTSPGPTITSNQGLTSDGEGFGMWASELVGLIPSTQYYVRAYGTTPMGTDYGNEYVFTTGDGLIAIATSEPTNVTFYSAMVGGNVESDGGAPVSSRGVVWSTTQSPTLESNLGTVSSGSGLGEFSATATGLDPETTYYIRAYATNGIGTQYGLQVSFTTLSQGEAGMVTDVNGNVYRTVTIGSQEWMAENLRVKNYNDGDPIVTNVIDSDWGVLTEGAFAIYPHDGLDGLGSDEEVLNAYGALYNWYAVDDSRGLCPSGWRVPSNDDWDELVLYLVNSSGLSNDEGDSNGIGNALKSCRQISSPLGGDCSTMVHPRWDSHTSHYGTDAFGLSLLPGGLRLVTDGFYSDVGSKAWFWTSQFSASSYAKIKTSFNDRGDLNDGSSHINNGNTVRCMRDVD